MVAYNHNAQCSLYCARICVSRRLRARKPLRSRDETPLSQDRRAAFADEVDSRPEGMPYSNYDILITVYSILTYILDLLSDFWVASYHYARAVEADQAQDPTNPAELHWNWFALTLIFIFVPSLVMSAFSLRWYISDYREACRREAGSTPISRWRWVFRGALMILQVGPVMRYIDSIHYGLKARWFSGKMRRAEREADASSSNFGEKGKEKAEMASPTVSYSPPTLQKICEYECKARYNYDMMLYEDADAAMLRLYECFMESAPQTILQLYILSRKFFACPKDNGPIEGRVLSRCEDNIRIDETDSLDVATTAEIVSVFVSVISISWGLVAYHKALRFSRPDKGNVSHLACVTMFIWRFFVLLPRVLVLALFASVFRVWHLALFVGGHFLAMLAWILSQNSRFCSSAAEERVFRFFAAVIHVFAFFNLLEGRTRFRLAAFYSLVFVENLAVVALWALFASPHHPLSVKLIVVSVVVGFFLVGVIFMIVHYRKLHPNRRNIPLWLDKEEWPCYSGGEASQEKEPCHCGGKNVQSDSCCRQENMQAYEFKESKSCCANKDACHGEATKSCCKEA